MLRKMQARVNDQTAALDAERKEQNLTKEQEGELRTLSKRQAEVEKIAHALAEKLGQSCATCGQQH